MHRHPMKHYLCESKEVWQRAAQYRADYIRLRSALCDVVESVGAEDFRFCDEQMKLIGIKFKNGIHGVPEGWTKPRHGTSRPKPGQANAALLAHFTPRGSHTIHKHPDLAKFWEWLAFPTSYNWTDTLEQSKGWVSTSDQELIWLSTLSPICLIVPDQDALLTYHKSRNETVIQGLDWKRPEGLREILPEEWEVMRAEHKLAKARAAQS